MTQRTGDRFDCPFCPKVITPAHVKRHLATHTDVPAKDMDIAWVRWLEARGIPSATADRLVALIERREDA